MEYFKMMDFTIFCSNPLFWLLSVTLFFLTIILYRKYSKLNNLHKRTVFITGCDSGFGYDLAIRLAGKNIPTIASCLTKFGEEKLRQNVHLQTRDQKLADCQFWTCLMDVTDTKSVQTAYKYVQSIVGDEGLWSIVCNAGLLGKVAPDDWLDASDYLSTLNVNLIGLIRTTKIFRPLVRIQQGRIVMISSVTGIKGLPSIGPYSVSKFAVQGYSQVLRTELYQQKVSVHVLMPGFFTTPLVSEESLSNSITSCWNSTSSYVKKLYGEEYVPRLVETLVKGLKRKASSSPSWVVDTYEHAITAKYPQLEYLVGYDALFQFYPLSLMSAYMQELIMRIWYWSLDAPHPQYTKNL